MKTIRELTTRMRETLAQRPRLTLRGRCVLLGSLVALCFSVALYDPVLMQFALMGLLLMAAALPLSWVNVSELTFKHAFPSSVYRNESFVVELRLENRGLAMGKADIDVRDGLVLRHWHTPASYAAVKPGRAVTQWQSSRVPRRGVFGNFRYILRSRFPLGLYQSMRWSKLPDRIVVYPRPVLPKNVENLLEVGIGFGGVRNSLSPRYIGEFKSMREYRTGDHAKRISWPFSARFQKLIVKELEQPCPREVAVLYHNYEPRGTVLSQQSFENSLQLLSGLFQFFSSRFIPFEFAASFADWQRIHVASDTASQRRVQILLATAKMKTSRSLGDLRRIMEMEQRRSVVQVIVSNSPTAWWIHELPRHGAPALYLDTSGEIRWTDSALAAV